MKFYSVAFLETLSGICEKTALAPSK